MNFSEVIGASLGSSSSSSKGQRSLTWSPDGRLVAWPSPPSRLQVREAATLQVIAAFSCVDAVQEVAWSPDSQYVLSASYKRGIVEVWAVGDPGWRCRLDGGSAGVIATHWAPDSRHLLTTAEFYVQLTVWSLVSGDSWGVCRPKAVVGGVALSPGGGHLAVAQRRECRDLLTLFETQDWTLVKTFPVCTRDLVGVSWGGANPGHPPRGHSNMGSILAVWDGVLEYKVALYSMSGHCVGWYSAYSLALGVLGCVWSPSGQFLAVSSCDNKVRLLSHPPLRVSAEFTHTTTITTTTTTTTATPGCVVYKETRTQNTGYTAALATAQSVSPLATVCYTEEPSRPISLATIPQAGTGTGTGTPSPPMAVFSSNGRYLATLRSDIPSAVWVWDVGTVSLAALLVHEDVVRDLAWDPSGTTRLAVVTGGCHIYFWSPLGTVVVGVPGGSHLTLGTVRWHPFGKSLIVGDRRHISVCYLDKTRP